MQVVSVGVSGDYNFFLSTTKTLGLPAPNSLTISRTTTMRYEHALHVDRFCLTMRGKDTNSQSSGQDNETKLYRSSKGQSIVELTLLTR
jgi:hypothetical protein